MRFAIAALSGLLFGLGLMISDMVNPARVRAFLDVADIASGTWDPTLMFVMGGAMAISAGAWLVSHNRATTLLGGAMPSPPSPKIDARLVAGSAIFGIGWGLVGICPGPSPVALGFGGAATAIFFAAMLAGMVAFWLLNRMLQRRHAAAWTQA
jgi:uncharacterized membrane protein YedE/YeeE